MTRGAIFFITVCAVFLIFYPQTEAQEWLFVGSAGESNSFRMVIEADDETLYAAGTQGSYPDFEAKVFYSTDGGETWDESAAIGDAEHCNDIVQASYGTLYVGTSPYGRTYYSTNGLTWTEWESFTGETDVDFLSITSNGDFFAGTQDSVNIIGGIYRSENNGYSWSQSTDPGVQSVYRLVESDSGDLFVAAGFTGYALRSTDDGATWSYTARISDVNYMYDMIEASDGYLYVTVKGLFGSKPIGVYKSTDGGASWNTIGSVPGADWLTALYEDAGSVIWVGGDCTPGQDSSGCVFYSDNGGANWHATGSIEKMIVNFLETSASGFLVASGSSIYTPCYGCLIDGECYADEDVNPTNLCESCDISQSTTGWTTKTCDDLNECTDDSCNPATGDCQNIDNTDPCDDGYACTGNDQCSGGTCTGDPAAMSGQSCRLAAGPCDVVETCDGVSATCPADAFKDNLTTCRLSAGDCDVAENCTGSSAVCPSDNFKDSSTTCRISAGDCDEAENCTGSSATCPVDGFKNNSTTCREEAGDCDEAEVCSGTSADCPVDVYKDSSTTCRDEAGDCDVAENCTGTSVDCPADGYEPYGESCRTAAGPCDMAEICDGVSFACPTDAFKDSSTTCRLSVGVCDVAENCTGSSATCPSDAFKDSSTTCRNAADNCDVAENCTGSSVDCPADVFKPLGADCDDGAWCNGNETCDGLGTCNDNTDPCSDDGLFCNGAESCDEIDDICLHSGYPCDPETQTCQEAGDSCAAAVSPEPPFATEWLASLSLSGDNQNDTLAMTVTDAGEVYLAGPFGAAKLDASGTLAWTRSQYGYFENVSQSVTGNIVFAGEQGVVALAPDGTEVWFNDSNTNITDLAVDDGGNVLVHSYGTNPGFYKYDSNGYWVWSRYETWMNCAVAFDSLGNAIITGASGYPSDIYLGKYDPAGGEIWSLTYDGPDQNNDYPTDVAIDLDGNVIVSGYTFRNVGGWDALTIKFGGETGSAMWTGLIAGPNDGYYDRPNAVTTDWAGNVLLVGELSDANDLNAFTAKYDGLGNELWRDLYYGTGGDVDRAWSLAVTPRGDLLVAGETYQGPGSSYDFLAMMYEGNGNGSWLGFYDGPYGLDRAWDIEYDVAGNVYVVGYSQSNVSHPYTYDKVVIKYAPCAGCIIDDACYSDGETNPTNSCEICDVAQSLTDWTNNDGAACDDGLFCTEDTECVEGVCGEGHPPDCRDGVGCTDDTCDEVNDTCVHTPNNANCDDGHFCNGAEICDADLDCLFVEDPCPMDDGLWCNGFEYCDEINGRCEHDGNPCDLNVEICWEETDSCLPGSDPMWASIPAGAFIMGSPVGEPGRNDDPGIETQHQVTLTRSFEIMRSELVQFEFEYFMGYNPSYFGPNGPGADCGPECPVEMVNWHEALAFANALSVELDLPECFDCIGILPDVTCSLKTEYASVYDCFGYRLPTESEWEYAVRAGTVTAYYSGDNNLDEVNECNPAPEDENLDRIGWYCSNAGGTTHSARDVQKEPNFWGLHEMSGNVHEWVWDGYAEYPDDVIDPEGYETAENKIVRGGGLSLPAKFCRSADRLAMSPVNRLYLIGFRLARTLCDGCFIDGACYQDGEANPANSCEICEEPHDPSEWTILPDGFGCDDGLYCTVNNQCLGGTCVGDERTCDDGIFCTFDFCEEEYDDCINDPMPQNGLECEDEYYCSVDEVCVNGTCTDGVPRICDDGEFCTVDFCYEEGDTCIYDPMPMNGANCDDGLFCNGDDVCSDGTCTHPTDPCPDDQNFCNGTESCDEDQNVCLHSGDPCESIPCKECDYGSSSCVNVDYGDSCDDGDFCNGTDICKIEFGTWEMYCDHSGDPCDSQCQECNPVAGVCDNLTGSCNNYSPCDGPDECSGGECVNVGPPLVCDDGIDCTDDNCGFLGCFYIANDANCNDNNVCTDDSCDSGDGCHFVNNTAICDDNLYCTINDACAGGTCDGSPRDCGPEQYCNDDADTCQPSAGEQGWGDPDEPAGTDTGEDVLVGGGLETTATGEVILEEGGSPVGPNGDGSKALCGAGCPLPTANRGALLGRIDGAKGPGDPFLLGSDFSGQMPATGDLILLVNDDDYSDNTGLFSVEISINNCPAGSLCLTARLHGSWDSTQHTCESLVQIDLYDETMGLVDSFLDVTFTIEGEAQVDMSAVAPGNYYVVLRHLNHVDLVTDEVVVWDGSSAVMVDLTLPDNVECGDSTMYDFGGGVYSMPAGDIEPDGRVALSDFNYLRTHWTETDPACDLDCDGYCRLGDFNKLRQTWNTQGCAP